MAQEARKADVRSQTGRRSDGGHVAASPGLSPCVSKTRRADCERLRFLPPYEKNRESDRKPDLNADFAGGKPTDNFWREVAGSSGIRDNLSPGMSDGFEARDQETGNVKSQVAQGEGPAKHRKSAPMAHTSM